MLLLGIGDIFLFKLYRFIVWIFVLKVNVVLFGCNIFDKVRILVLILISVKILFFVEELFDEY